MSKEKTRFKSVFLAGKFHGVFKSQDYYQSNQWIHLNNRCFVWSENFKLMKLKCVQLENVSRKGGREGRRKEKEGEGGEGRGQGRREGWCSSASTWLRHQKPRYLIKQRLWVCLWEFFTLMYGKIHHNIVKQLSFNSVQFRSVAQLCPTLRPHGLLHARPPCPSPTPRAYSNSCPLSQWCHPTISSSVVPFSYCSQSFPASGSFQMSKFFPSGSQRVGVSASASVLPMNIQDWFP